MIRSVTGAASLPALMLAAAISAAAAQAGQLDQDQAIARSERAVGRTIGDYSFVDSTGARLSLAGYRGRPLVVSLVYSSCSSICPPATQHLMAAVAEAQRALGADRFEVLTVGFDARNDTPARMAQFAAVQGVKLPHWRLASGDADTIDALLRDLGFSYAAFAGGFEHIEQTTIIDRDGTINRQVYGDDYPIQMLVEPLKALVYGTTISSGVAGLIDRVRFICTIYDPGSGRYRLDYGLMFGSVIAGLSLVAFGGFIVREWRRAKPT